MYCFINKFKVQEIVNILLNKSFKNKEVLVVYNCKFASQTIYNGTH